MSEPLRILLVGATGLVGNAVMNHAVGRDSMRLLALARREVALPAGARMEVMLAPPEGWAEAIRAIAPDRIICALGTTIAKQDGDQQAFAAVDRDLVLKVAEHARAAGVERFVAVSSAGASQHSKNFYLKIKGETEAWLGKAGFKRLDMLRPGLLKGSRTNDARPVEQLGRIAAPLTDLFLHGEKRKFRSISAADVAAAALQLCHEKAAGRFTYEHDQILRLAARWKDS